MSPIDHLKPCPYCGGEGKFIDERRDAGGGPGSYSLQYAFVQCRLRRARTRGIWECDEPNSSQRLKMVVSLWNQRTWSCSTVLSAGALERQW